MFQQMTLGLVRLDTCIHRIQSIACQAEPPGLTTPHSGPYKETP